MPRPTDLQPNERVVGLPNGKRVGYAEYGQAGGTAIFAFHGTPASRLGFEWADGAARSAGVRLIAVDRPGIGISPRRKLWTLADHAQDIALLADTLRVERFGILGWSGGGPYVLANAFHNGPRLLGAVSSSGCGPLDGATGTQGMNALDRYSIKLANRAPWLLSGLLRTVVGLTRLSPGLGVKSMEADLSESDKAELRKLGQPPRQAMAFFVDAFRQGAGGVIQDYRNIGRPFGFELEAITAPVVFWQGDADRMVPVAQFEEMASRVPQAVPRLCPGEGHLLIYAHIDEMLAQAAGRA